MFFRDSLDVSLLLLTIKDTVACRLSSVREDLVTLWIGSIYVCICRVWRPRCYGKMFARISSAKYTKIIIFVAPGKKSIITYCIFSRRTECYQHSNTINNIFRNIVRWRDNAKYRWKRIRFGWEYFSRINSALLSETMDTRNNWK